MKIKWQWFLGGAVMFWVSIAMFISLIIGFTVTYVFDVINYLYMEKQKVPSSSIETISKQYVSDLGIKINRPIKYKFVKYKVTKQDKKLLGTFHEWNGVYYIDISIDLYNDPSLKDTVIHETRHMLVEYLKDQKILDLTKYTEEIAADKNFYYDYLFDSGIYLLKEEENKNGKI